MGQFNFTKNDITRYEQNAQELRKELQGTTDVARRETLSNAIHWNTKQAARARKQLGIETKGAA